jgi:signal transduction histidine kinase/ActR/RegA family two-component response regulator
MDELLNKAPCGFLTFTDDGLIVEVNATLLDLLGRDPGELEGRHVESILSVAGRIFYQTHFFPLLKLHGRVEEIYLALHSKNGDDVPVLVNAARRERGGASVNDCVFVPIRQRSQFEDQILRAKKAAEEATRAKDEFLAVVSHELRTPLNAILGWAQMLRTRKLDEETVVRAFEIIERNANSQAQLVEDILDFSRIISGKLRIDVRPVELASVVEAATDVVRPAADAKGIKLHPILDTKVGPVSGDPDRLQQVLWNLLSNAIKFTPKGGSVKLRLARVNSSAEITVSDTGQGINPEFLPYVFERFQQADPSTTRRHGGLGLGMAITRHLVELHGGTISAHSPGENMGATFTLRLPLMSVYKAEQPPHAIAAHDTPADEFDMQFAALPRLEGLRVLVVDDERDARDLLNAVLTQSGAQVTAVSNVADAVETLGQVKYDLLVSDIEMPDEDGYSLIRKVRAFEEGRGRRTPAIALTAHARFADRMRALSAGYQMHVPKPVQPAELIVVIANLTSRD